MPAAAQVIVNDLHTDQQDALAMRIARATVGLTLDVLPSEVIAKVKLCLMDLIGCAFESRHLAWSRQAMALAQQVENGATIIGAGDAVAVSDAAFANAVMGHGLVREDMHSGSISHLGIVVLPTLLALAQTRPVGGRRFIAAAVAGYEAGAQIGRAVMDAELARIHRPTGITGPIAGAIAGAHLLGLDLAQTTSACALAANTTAGFNQWAHTGGSEMYFHPGTAARNAVTVVRLAQSGAFASPSALDGEAGLFASLGKRSNASKVHLFQGAPEILSVYHKAVPVCNFAQSACQAALQLAQDQSCVPERIAAITVRVPRAGALYPGCNYTGPFAHALQAKMSIQYNVAAALLLANVSEKNFDLLADPRLQRLIGIMKLEIDDAMTQAYPGRQGGEVQVRDIDGQTRHVRLENVVYATADDVQKRFRCATAEGLGEQRMLAIESCLNDLESSDDAGRLPALLSPARS